MNYTRKAPDNGPKHKYKHGFGLRSSHTVPELYRTYRHSNRLNIALALLSLASRAGQLRTNRSGQQKTLFSRSNNIDIVKAAMGIKTQGKLNKA